MELVFIRIIIVIIIITILNATSCIRLTEKDVQEEAVISRD